MRTRYLIPAALALLAALLYAPISDAVTNALRVTGVMMPILSSDPIPGAGRGIWVDTSSRLRFETGTASKYAITSTSPTLVAGDLPNTAVTAGSYTLASITVDAQGRLTAASSGTASLVGSSIAWASGTSPGQYTFGTGAGNGSPAATSIAVVGGNNGGTLTFTTTASPAASGATIVTVYFSTSYTNAPSVTIGAADSDFAAFLSGGGQPYVETATDRFVIKAGGGTGLTGTTAYIVHWQTQAWQ